MAKDHLDKYDIFYQEIPTRDYLQELDTEIKDLVDDHNKPSTLNADQVPQLTEDIRSTMEDSSKRGKMDNNSTSDDNAAH